METLLTIQQVAQHLNITDRSVFYLIARGKLAATKIGRCTRISPQVVSAYVEANTQRPIVPTINAPRPR